MTYGSMCMQIQWNPRGHFGGCPLFEGFIIPVQFSRHVAACILLFIITDIADTATQSIRVWLERLLFMNRL